MLVMQYLDLYVIIMPMLHKTGFVPSVLDLFTLIGVGGALGAVFLWLLPIFAHDEVTFRSVL